jgi:hypothetical protein
MGLGAGVFYRVALPAPPVSWGSELPTGSDRSATVVKVTC